MAKSVKTIPFEYIESDEDFNSRKVYEDIDELAASIEEEGLLQPIGVYVDQQASDDEVTRYKVAYGFRRHRAITKLREKYGEDAFSEIDAVVVQGTLQDLKQKNLKENIDRKSLKPHEISKAIEEMVNCGLEQRDIAPRLGRPQSWVSYHYKVATKLGVAASKAFEAGELTLEQALCIADVPETEQKDLVEEILNAETRNEARQLAKSASKAAGSRRAYANKGKPTAKNLSQKIREYSFTATASGVSNQNKAFYNGLVAGMRVALGDVEVGGVTPEEDYYDTSFAARDDEETAAEKPSKKSAKAPKDAAPVVKGKRGRKKKVAA